MQLKIEQLRIGFDNFSYILYNTKKRNAAIVDPSYNIAKQVSFIEENKISVEYIILTHHHSDHISQTKRLKDLFPNSKIVMGEPDSLRIAFKVDIKINDKDQLKLTDVTLDFLLTPGHTKGGVCIIVNNEAIITGDTLFIDNCGRTDLADGDFEVMFETLQKIKQLPDHLVVYPGHDYGPKPFDSLGNQKKTNPTLTAKNLDEFSKIP